MKKMPAGQSNRKNNTLRQPAPLQRNYEGPLDFEKINSLVASIEAPFLQARANDYARAAHALINILAANSQDVATPSLSNKLKLFGKHARILDLILAVAGTTGHLSPHSKATAQKIRLAIEAKLASLVQSSEDGILQITLSSGILRAETHSSLGRRLARLFARVVPPTEGDKSITAATRASFLSATDDAKIKEYLTKAEQLCKNGRVADAEPLYKDILAIDRKNPDALRGLGLLYLDLGRYEAAIASLKQAVLFYPRDILLLNYLGEALAKQDLYQEAIERHREALKIEPNNAATLAKLGKALMLAKQNEEAEETLKKAIALAPNSVEAIANLGLYFHIAQSFDKAALNYLKAIKLSPHNTFAIANLGTLRGQQRKAFEGIELLDRALTIEPNDPHLQFMKSQLMLNEGQYDEGWRLYNAGLGKDEWRGNPLAADKPLWHGEISPQMRLLIVREQGLGDVLQFVRYAALCKERVGEVYVLCTKPLERLLKACPFIDEVFTAIGLEEFDAQVAIMSLPHIFGTTLENIPTTIPYLFVPPKVQSEWANKFHADDKRLKVGLVWSGSLRNQGLQLSLAAKRRNIGLKHLAPLFDIEAVQFYSLQMGETVAEIKELGLQDRLIDYMPNVKDFADTAAIIEHLDLVITVDTSVAHVAGGLGKPVWILSRYDACWRWLNNRPDSPWYPTARIFGQPRFGDWEPVIDQLQEALNEKVAAQ